MSGTYAPECLHQVIASSLAFCTDIYRSRAGGELQFEGVRPGPGWHSHGYFPVLRWMLVQGEVGPVFGRHFDGLLACAGLDHAISRAAEPSLDQATHWCVVVEDEDEVPNCVENLFIHLGGDPTLRAGYLLVGR